MAESPQDQVTRLHAKIGQRADKAKKYAEYYDGQHPLKFASPEFQSITGDLFDDFADNWCQIVPDSVIERLVPLGFRLEDGSIDKEAGKAWRRNECDVEYSLAALESLLSARSFGMVWKPDGVNTEITFQTVGQSVVEYAPGRRNVRSAGLNVWSDGSDEFATLFRRDEGYVYRFQRPAKNAGKWQPRTTGLRRSESAHFANPMGNEVPIVEFANRSRLHGHPMSEIATVIPLQDAVNTVWAHVLTASDALALPARVVLGMDRPTKDILDDAGEVVGEEDLPLDNFRKDRLLWLEGRDAKIGEFSAANLENLLVVVEKAVQHVAAQTRTPPHYLLGEMTNVGADALVAAETGLVAKVEDRQRGQGASLRELMRLEAIAAGDTKRAESLALGRVHWRDAQFRSEAQYADALTKYKAIGVPDEALWERIPGVDSDTIERWKKMRDDQAAAIVGGDIAGMFGPKPEAEPEDEAA